MVDLTALIVGLFIILAMLVTVGSWIWSGPTDSQETTQPGQPWAWLGRIGRTLLVFGGVALFIYVVAGEASHEQQTNTEATRPSISFFDFGDYTVQATGGIITRIDGPVLTEIPAVPGGRTGAICRDGWRSSATGRGACSWHGGVDHWLIRATEPSRQEWRPGTVCDGLGSGRPSLRLLSTSAVPHCWRKNEEPYTSNADLEAAFSQLQTAEQLATRGRPGGTPTVTESK